MNSLKPYTEYIESELAKVEFPEKPNNLYDPLRYFLKLGGKRIRPIMTLLGAELFGTAKEVVISQALSIEVFHNFTLIHDDMIDEAPMRRNQQTVHQKWDTNIAILSGDALVIKAYQLLSQIEPTQLPTAFELLNKTALEVCEGQIMDTDFETQEDVTIAKYIEMIRLKTSVLLGAALKIGALVAQASDQDQRNLYNFGQNIGIAFQIQDDILDLYANPDKFGKQVGGDVIANKKTLLHLTAIGKATLEQREIIRQLQNEDKLGFKVNRTKELFDQLMVKEDCQLMMQDYYNRAMKSLDAVEIDSDRKQTLIELAEYLVQRDV
ncbi:MAG: polyprenyl synthetase family protein [Crocinitomicaceae bacterium]|nr:polyprenyl synthetase family protein [Crocinitomicaceae bacterium]